MPRIALAIPCYLGVLRPADAAHAARVLRALGDEVTTLDGLCCGQPPFNSGFRSEAKATGRALLRAARPFEAVVMPSGSCVAMVQHYLPALFDGRAPAANRVAQRVHEFASYVARHPALEQVRFRLDGAAAYHDSCHARRELRITNDVAALLARVEGFDVRRLNEEAECCGFGGTFSVKLPEVSVAMMTAKLGDVAASGARVLVSTDLSCLVHLQAGADGTGMTLETWSVAELLSRALVEDGT